LPAHGNSAAVHCDESQPSSRCGSSDPAIDAPTYIDRTSAIAVDDDLCAAAGAAMRSWGNTSKAPGPLSATVACDLHDAVAQRQARYPLRRASFPQSVRMGRFDLPSSRSKPLIC